MEGCRIREDKYNKRYKDIEIVVENPKYLVKNMGNIYQKHFWDKTIGEVKIQKYGGSKQILDG